MKFGGEFGDYGDTSFRPAYTPFSALPPASLEPLMPTRRAKDDSEAEGGESEERVGGGMSEPTFANAAISSSFFHRRLFSLMITAHLTGWKNFWSSSNKSWHVFPRDGE